MEEESDKGLSRGVREGMILIFHGKEVGSTESAPDLRRGK